MRRLLLFAVLIAGLPLQLAAQELRLPNKPGTVKFAVIGDAGTGSKEQVAVGKEMAAWRAKFPFEFVTALEINCDLSEFHN